jgi:acyl-CoA hydrolase
MVKIENFKYNDLYQKKLISAKNAAKMVKSGDRILYAVFLGRPVDFDRELSLRKEELFDVQITQCSGMQPSYITTASDPTHEHFICNSWFFDTVDRRLGDKDLMFYSA